MKCTNSCTDLLSSVCDLLFMTLQDIKVITWHTKPLHKLLKCIELIIMKSLVQIIRLAKLEEYPGLTSLRIVLFYCT